MRSSLVTLSPSYSKWFSLLIDREVCRGEFQKKKKIKEGEEIAALNMGARKEYSSINFLGGFIEGISSLTGDTNLLKLN